MNISSRKQFDKLGMMPDANGNLEYLPYFDGIHKIESVGTSPIFEAVANRNISPDIKKGDTVYFKGNSHVGMNAMGRVSESDGSCEDVAEVLGYYLLKDLAEKLKDRTILQPTVYDFARYTDEYGKYYSGCLTKETRKTDENLVYGDFILSHMYPENSLKSGKLIHNNIDTYSIMLPKIFEQYKIVKKSETGIVIPANAKYKVDPICNRYLANLMFFDYLTVNSDRHTKNICFEMMNDGTNYTLHPLAVLDNGAAFSMQSSNCSNMYQQQSELIEKLGKIDGEAVKTGNAFQVDYSLGVGKRCFNQDLESEYQKYSYVEQICLLMRENKTIFKDFVFLYKNLDLEKAVLRLSREGLSVNLDGSSNHDEFLPNFYKVASEALKYKKRELSKAMAKLMNIEFDEEKFNQDELFYLNAFSTQVKDNNLRCYIASDDEVRLSNQQYANKGKDEQERQPGED